MHDARLGLGLEVHCNNGAVEETSSDALAVRRRADRDTEVLLGEAGLTLVSLEMADFDLSVGETDDELSMAVIGPGHAGDGSTLSKLVANSLLVTPFGAEAVDEDDAI